jgi:hypothetical protein
MAMPTPTPLLLAGRFDDKTPWVSDEERALGAAALALGISAIVLAIIAVGMVVGLLWLVGRALGWLP